LLEINPLSFPRPKKRRTGGVEAEVTGLNHAGEGVARVEGLVYFIPGALPGERVLAEGVESKKNYVRARLVSVLDPSPARRVPECVHFGECGGCRLQHMEYTAQLKQKTDLVRESLQRIAGLPKALVRETLGMSYPWHYRNKAVFQVGEERGALLLGFYREGTPVLVPLFGEKKNPVAGCLLVDGEINAAAKTVQDLLNRYAPGGLKAKRRPGRSFFRQVVIRKSFHTREIMVVFVTESGPWREEAALARHLTSIIPRAVSVARAEVPAGGGSLGSGNIRVVAGSDHIVERIGDLTFILSPASFFQVNPAQTLVLYRKIADYAGLTGTETVVDAFCGVGSISLFLAGRAGEVTGIESHPQAVKDAVKNARQNGVKNARFYCKDVEKLLPEILSSGKRPDVAVFDPPRRGLGRRTVEAVAACGVPKIVYVSCHPGTLARDLGYFCHSGYALEKVQPVDMFPWTHHVECVALVTRVEK